MTESVLHINCLELLVVQRALQSLFPILINQTVLVMSDNVVTVYYINRQGSRRLRKLCKLAVALWDWCLPCSITL